MEGRVARHRKPELISSMAPWSKKITQNWGRASWEQDGYLALFAWSTLKWGVSHHCNSKSGGVLWIYILSFGGCNWQPWEKYVKVHTAFPWGGQLRSNEASEKGRCQCPCSQFGIPLTSPPPCGQHEAFLCSVNSNSCVRWCAVQCIIFVEYFYGTYLQVRESITDLSQRLTSGAVRALPGVTEKNNYPQLRVKLSVNILPALWQIGTT